MKFIITKDHEEANSVIAQLVLKRMHSDKERVNVSVTTSETSVRRYQILVKQTKRKTYFSNVHYYIFDEFWYKNDPKDIYHASLDYKHFNLADVEENHIHNLDESNVDTFDEDIQQAGGLDLIIMGVGSNGHPHGDQPGTFDSWNTSTHRTDRHATPLVEELLLQLLKKDLYSGNIIHISNYYISVGSKTVMVAKSIVFLMSEKQKTEAVKRAFFGLISEDFPISIFQLHPNVTVVLGEAIVGEIKELL